MAFPTQDNYMQQDTSRIYDRVYQIRRATGRISALIEKGTIPTGQGYNYLTPIYLRSIDTGGNDWQQISLENNTSNNCNTQPNNLDPASQQIAWTAYERTIRSNRICFEDLQRAYNGREQLSAQQDNFAANTVDKWEDQDTQQFFLATGHKVIANSSLTESTTTAMPATAPTTRGIQTILDLFYERIAVDGGCEESYAKANGQPLITAIMSQQQHRNIIKEDASTRQDFNYADMGEDGGSTMLKNWLGDMKSYSGFMHVINIRQKRYNFHGAVWSEESYYTTQAATFGTAAVVSPLYTNASYEDIYLWHPQVVKRNMPKPGGSYGAGTSFNPVKWNGQIMWVNVPNTDVTSAEYNPFQNTGRYYAALQAGWQQIKPQYGYAIRVQRCSKFAASACY